MANDVVFKPTHTIEVDLGINPGGEAEDFFVNECAKAMDKFVPFREGNLSNYVIVGNEIQYQQLYAEYQYNGMREDGTHKIVHRTRTMHPRASSLWDRVMWIVDGPRITAEVQAFIDKGKKK